MNPDKPGPADLIKSPALLIAFGLGTGLSPVAPGTVGTLLAVPLWWALSGLGTVPYMIITGLAFGFGVWICGRVMPALGEHDHPGIVFDEVVGFLVAMLAVPVNAAWAVLGFAVFRFFDIVKPWPINWFDRRLGGGLGVMLDDVVAGLFTAVIMLAARHLAQF